MATINPPTLQALGAYWTAQGGVNLGVVGDTAHIGKGVSYHLGQDQLSPDAYSIKTARDKAGLSDAASAIDLGKLDGSLANLQAFSRDFVERARADGPGFSDIREIIYSPDGKTVLRWDRERGAASEPRPGEADDSHLTHTHISWYRDAEKRDHTIAFRPYFEGDVKFIQASDLGQTKLLRLPLGTPLYGFDGSVVLKTPTARDWDYVGLVDAKGAEKVVAVNTGKVYPDAIPRPTLLVAKTGTLVDAPAPPTTAAVPQEYTVTVTDPPPTVEIGGKPVVNGKVTLP